MSDTQQPRSPQPEQMSDEELQQILRDDASKPGSEDTDMELIFHIMEVLATRRRERGEGKSPAEALDSFNKKYFTDEEDRLISEKVTGHTGKHAFCLWKRIAAVAAVLVLVIAFGTANASAWNFNLWEIIGQWSIETFHFGYFGDEAKTTEPGSADSVAYTGLRDVLNDLGIDTPLAPTWFPDGYGEGMIDIQDNPRQRVIFASYQCDDQVIVIQIMDYLGKDPYQAEQSGTLMEVYESNGSSFYIFDNFGQLQAAWVTDSYDCYILGPLTLDEMKMMIDSIEKG